MQYGLIGKKLGHSYSVEVHNKIGGYNYELLEIPENEVGNFIKSKDFYGINVTIPYKETVIPFLDEISDGAKKIGAVNTILNRDGKLLGYNTDFMGMTALIKRSGVSVEGKKALILGTGGTSKTAYHVLKSFNAKEIILVSRTKTENTLTYDEAALLHSDAQIIINTTPCGMFPNTADSPLSLTAFSNIEGVFDAIYNPLSTRLVLEAKSMKIPAFDGLYMLVAQAVYSSGFFFDKEIDTDLIDKIYNELKSEKQNVVLIGMPSSGKSTIGNILAKALNKPFLDTDEEIVKKQNMPIPQIFSEFGEPAFREIEKEVIFECSKLSGHIISTGGGAVLNPENITNLKQNGILVFLDRSLENLIATPDRPLSSNSDALKTLFEKRYPIYKNSADIIADSNLSPEDVAENIRKELL